MRALYRDCEYSGQLYPVDFDFSQRMFGLPDFRSITPDRKIFRCIGEGGPPHITIM